MSEIIDQTSLQGLSDDCVRKVSEKPLSISAAWYRAGSLAFDVNVKNANEATPVTVHLCRYLLSHSSRLAQALTPNREGSKRLDPTGPWKQTKNSVSDLSR